MRSFCAAYVYIFRGTPLFIQLYFAYSLFRVSGLPTYRLPADPGTFGTKIFAFLLDALFLGAFVLLLNTAAYTAVILKNALLAVPVGEAEAADAFGFAPRKKFWRVTWPAAIRIAWPSYTNEMVFLFLSTALVYTTIPVLRRIGGADYKDVFAVARDTADATFNPFISYLPAMAIFLILTQILFALARAMESHLNRHLPNPSATKRPRFLASFLR